MQRGVTLTLILISADRPLTGVVTRYYQHKTWISKFWIKSREINGETSQTSKKKKAAKISGECLNEKVVN